MVHCVFWGSAPAQLKLTRPQCCDAMLTALYKYSLTHAPPFMAFESRAVFVLTLSQTCQTRNDAACLKALMAFQQAVRAP
eukprot:1158139-Pelagomonas_calceolata.AAC.10